jgi:hypothetical protein
LVQFGLAMDDKETTGTQDSCSICSKCGCDIICVTPDTRPFAIIVRDPHGQQHLGGEFCLECMTFLALHGVLIYPLPPDVAARRLHQSRERGNDS